MESLLTHVASLTSSLADKDAVIGSVIDNLNTVLGIVAARDKQLSDLIVSLQQFVTGLAGDRDAIFNSLQTIDTLATTTSGFLARTRARRWPPTSRALGKLSGNLADSGDVLEGFLKLAPMKIDLITRTAINGSWFNFFMCGARGYVVLPVTGRRTARRPASQVPAGSGLNNGERGCELMARESKPFRDRNPVIIGAVSLTVIAVLVFLAFNAQSLPLIGGGTGLQARSSPRRPACSPTTRCGSPGVKVGKVESLALEHGAVTVEFRVTDAFVGDRSEAAIKIETVLGAKYLALVPRGSDRARPRQADPGRPHRVALRRGRGLRRPVDDGRAGRHHAAGRTPSRCCRRPSPTPRTRCARRCRAWPGSRTPSPRATPSSASCSRPPARSARCWPTATASSPS